MNEILIYFLKKEIEEIFKIDLDSTLKYRKRKYVNARIVFSVVCKRNIKMTLIEISEVLKQSHSNISYYINVFNGEERTNSLLVRKYNEINIHNYSLKKEITLEGKIKQIQKQVNFYKLKIASHKSLKEAV